MQVEIQELRRAHDPNNGKARLDMWIVWAFEDGKGLYQMAYCSRQGDAELIKLALASHVMQSSEQSAEQAALAVDDNTIMGFCVSCHHEPGPVYTVLDDAGVEMPAFRCACYCHQE